MLHCFLPALPWAARQNHRTACLFCKRFLLGQLVEVACACVSRSGMAVGQCSGREYFLWWVALKFERGVLFEREASNTSLLSGHGNVPARYGDDDSEGLGYGLTSPFTAALGAFIVEHDHSDFNFLCNRGVITSIATVLCGGTLLSTLYSIRVHTRTSFQPQWIVLIMP